MLWGRPLVFKGINKSENNAQHGNRNNIKTRYYLTIDSRYINKWVYIQYLT